MRALLLGSIIGAPISVDGFRVRALLFEVYIRGLDFGNFYLRADVSKVAEIQPVPSSEP